MNRLATLIISLALPFAAGFIGALATGPAIDGWYATLVKPSFNPPNWIFGPVWTLLYLLMGLALFRIVAKKSWSDGLVKLFLIHLVINSTWSIVFFGLNQIFPALIIILILLLLIAFFVKKFWPIDRLAAYLLLPYLAWVTFATVLNFSLWYLN